MQIINNNCDTIIIEYNIFMRNSPKQLNLIRIPLYHTTVTGKNICLIPIKLGRLQLYKNYEELDKSEKYKYYFTLHTENSNIIIK